MSKKRRSSKKQSKKNQSQIPVVPLAILAVVLVAIVGVFAMFSNGGGAATTTGDAVAANSSSPQLITPANYTSEFVEGGEDHILIDVRTPGEFAGGHIDGAININVEEIGQRLDEIPTDKPIVLYCRSGNRSSQAARILDNAGFEGIYDLGGIVTWANQGYPVVQ